MNTSIDLAALLCSRLCHDMLSPVGALNNGLELLADERDPEMRQRCLELLEQSARTSASKLKFFRLAYGAAGGFGEMVPAEEPREVLQSLIANDERVTLDWAVGEQSLPKPAVKVLLNLASIGLDALVRGGTLSIGAERSRGATEIAIRSAGPRIAFDGKIGLALSGDLDPAELSGKTAPAHMIRQLASELGGGVQYAQSDGALVLGAVLPDPEGLIG
ncbi:histidine phosphotransferase [Erythrobacter arachoides]|uniref:Histidine phosphotransferase n=1 Tax=Aurantiacibacter arachoides TaxID=1850444 RepID=A0A844ZXA2_9SPHN|nr:histidine phosphotransferase family protein [Aurantiacibacter arachoides]MXO92368.1 histidine phosphotransferase [Aurantiacibacter arachoides]GGD57715.1 histidine phosphotransferase [Aurantiacibacter arachoides]